MLTLKIIFWALLFIVFYAYLGYGILLFFLVKIKRLVKGRPRPADNTYEPDVTLFVAAYNEKDYVDAKVQNSSPSIIPRIK